MYQSVHSSTTELIKKIRGYFHGLGRFVRLRQAFAAKTTRRARPAKPIVTTDLHLSNKNSTGQ